ncbi:anti-sigma factor domain-containing protein [Flavobacterium sp. RHBU_24]|uniref:anti-sigma factor n=1 Tax=Flavobacterium sp. RHBU_24 TaxID=3391185 RepID=UPI003984DD88
MEMEEYIASGTLEFYVYGLLSEQENLEVDALAKKHNEVAAEILAIEKTVINLSYAVAPPLSAENFERIREKLIEKHGGVVQLQPKRSLSGYIGWAAAVVLMMGLGIQSYKYNQATEQVQSATAQRSKFEQLVADANKKNAEHEAALAIVRDVQNTTVKLAGQAVAPQAYATVYLNKAKGEIYVDVAGLPKAPAGKVYQIWALKLEPLTPTSIGLVDDNEANSGVFKMDNYMGAQAFGITLEPAGGSKTPTMEQLYTLGKV